MAENRPCTICGETDPYPASLCLAKITGCAERDKPCQYSVEGGERLRAAMEAQSAPSPTRRGAECVSL